MIRSFALLAALAAMTAWTALAAPAQAREEDASIDMRTSLEFQSWNWSSPLGARLEYMTPMTVFTVTDRTGSVGGMISSMTENESRRIEARNEAVLKDERAYSWRVEEARVAPGRRTGFSVGTGSIFGQSTTNATVGNNPPSLTGASLSAHYAKLFMEADTFQIGPGVVVMEFGTSYWSALALPPGTAYTPAAKGNLMYIEAWNWPIGFRYRINTPFGLVIEPSFSFDWLYTLYYGVNGNWRFDARTFGIEAAYYLHPQVKLRAGYSFNALAHNDVAWMDRADVVMMRNATLGAVLYF